MEKFLQSFISTTGRLSFLVISQEFIQMLIDAFTFFNEYDMLEARLKYYYDFVDKFVISECDHTHAGNYKGFNFEKEQKRYEKYLDKIVYLKLSIDPNEYDFTKPKSTNYSAGNWILEKQQRNHIVKGLSGFEDFVMISDVDEVCTIQSIQESMNIFKDEMVGIGSAQEMFWYSFKTKEPNLWSGSVLTKVKFMLRYSPEHFRERRWVLPKYLKGYHMTYFMDIEKMKYKIENFAHQELNQEKFTQVDKIKERISKNIEPFERQNVPLVEVKKEDIDSKIYEIFNICSKNN
jgi:beta-1,4-mannosyl-glycoprotein beta-1,4-N-acetylglucosaminyltransferase